MPRIVCPACLFVTDVRGEGVSLLCPSCGRLLNRTVCGGAWDRNIPDDQLLADVREAFESSQFGFVGAGESAARDPSSVDRWADDSWIGDSRGCGERAGVRPTVVALPVGSRLDDFEVVDEVGRGGMGIVYRARQMSLDRDVALKVLPPALGRRESAVRRFRTEALAVARLKHPNVVPIYAQGEYEGHLYYAMELVDGVSLDEAIRSRPEMLSSSFRCNPSTTSAPPALDRSSDTRRDRGEPVPPARTLEDFRHIARLVAGAADGLAHAYDQGVIHRDIKPHNLLLSSDGRLHITDFGLAHLTDEPHLTISGEVIGTAAYLSPEQVRGDAGAIDHRTDIYSLGATLYELLTHRRPFEGHTRDQILTGICMTEPPRLRRLDPRIPLDLETICLRAMEKDPARRYPTAAAMAGDLRRFADGRPILSRRVGPVERTFKWVRRHRAVTAAVVAVAAVVVLSGGLVHSARAARRERAADLLQSAYERLAYLDYRRPDLVSGAIEQAASLGADPVELGLTQALAAIGLSDNTGAVGHLHSVLALTPDDMRARYMLAWAQWRSGEKRASSETVEEADTSGGPTTPDAWFFRGLAAHFDRPAIAVDSYRRANALRAAEHEFYPQAVLHLARAHNQQMYAARTLGPFVEADASLRQLIEHRHYGAYPYYLLSIAHRLAGEIRETDPGEGDGKPIDDHYAEALHWARLGQAEDPTDDRPVTAEAECLETLGRYDEAIESRTRAIGLATKPREQWEGHHYRWRLYFWTGAFESALADLGACETFSPGGIFYAYVYPAWVLTEMGRVEEAAARARALADRGPTDASATLWSAATLRLMGRAAEADELLTARAGVVDFSVGLQPPQSAEWVETLYTFCLGETSLAELVALADGEPAPRKLLGEAHFHAGVMALGAGDRAAAFDHFEASYRSFDEELGYTFHAKVVREKTRDDPGWPPWLPSAGRDPAGGMNNVDATDHPRGRQGTGEN